MIGSGIVAAVDDSVPLRLTIGRRGHDRRLVAGRQLGGIAASAKPKTLSCLSTSAPGAGRAR
ncbi:hypothetical protein I546_5817 [Mycobacterium kansasii 732]|nr:hypothetical protein I546_5817 [Mycobacterium kansasii 732]KZS67525.1 hypothetical protein A4G27_13085 [Mycobacterium kansasii]